MKKLTNFLKKYLPDILFLIGVFVLSYINLVKNDIISRLNEPYPAEYKVLGIMLIAISIVISIRYFTKK